jgi:hypothetical protein
MKIKLLHAHFLISIGSYSNERIGFTVELDDSEDAAQAVSELREHARAIVGKPADELRVFRHPFLNHKRQQIAVCCLLYWLICLQSTCPLISDS